MIYIIQATNPTLINKKIQEINLKNHKMVYFDFNQDTQSFLDEVNQYSLFSDTNKMYVIKNANLVCDLKSFEQFSYLLDIILKDVLKNDHDYILICPNKPLANKKIKPFLEQTQLITINNLTNKNKSEFLKKILNDFNIKLGFNAFNLLLEILPLDMQIIESEVYKLKAHSLIDEQLINRLITKYEEANIFKLWEYFLSKNHTELFKELDNLYSNKYDPMQIINILAAQITQSFIIKQLLDDRYNETEITNILEINLYVLKKQIIFLKQWSINQLKYIINNLYKTEILIKSNNLDKEDLLKFFFIENCDER